MGEWVVLRLNLDKDEALRHHFVWSTWKIIVNEFYLEVNLQTPIFWNCFLCELEIYTLVSKKCKQLVTSKKVHSKLKKCIVTYWNQVEYQFLCEVTLFLKSSHIYVKSAHIYVKCGQGWSYNSLVQSWKYLKGGAFLEFVWISWCEMLVYRLNIEYDYMYM